jgi:hypothetical protein
MVMKDDFLNFAHRAPRIDVFAARAKSRSTLDQRVTQILIFGKDLCELGAKHLDSFGFLHARRARKLTVGGAAMARCAFPDEGR